MYLPISSSKNNSSCFQLKVTFFPTVNFHWPQVGCRNTFIKWLQFPNNSLDSMSYINVFQAQRTTPVAHRSNSLDNMSVMVKDLHRRNWHPFSAPLSWILDDTMKERKNTVSCIMGVLFVKAKSR